MYYYKINIGNKLYHFRKSKKAIRNLKDAQKLNGSNGIVKSIEGISLLRYLLKI